MTKYLEVTGKTEDEAIAKALEQLGLDRDSVSVEILARAKSGFLGIGSTPAKIRVTYEGPDDEPEVVTEPVVVEKPKAVPAPKAPKAPAAPKAAPAPKAPAAPVSAVPADDETADKIVTFLTGLMAHMGANATPRVTVGEEGIYEVVLEGDDLGALIGRRGETLDAIQQLTGYSVNRGASKRVRIHLDAENYRARREESLVRLANKVAGKVVKYRRDVTLEPMNAYERHIIHTALQNHPRVTTYSTGTEPNRRTVVSFKG